jgi:NAD-dependent deacetylase
MIAVPTMQHLIRQAADITRQSRRLVVLTGAGMSKESGIPTFREAQEGLWARHDPMKLATMQGFLANPQLVWEWYQYRFGLVAACQPNPGHYAIADLARLLPHVVVVTQNIDGLHAAAGSADVVELHGSIHRYKCVYGHMGHTLADLAGQTAVPPRCPRPGCHGMMRPDVVWFGEMLDQDILARAAAECESCDVMLIVGTSGVVQPAASLPYHAWNAGARLIEINPLPSELTDLAHVYLQGPAGVMLPEILALLGKG